MALLFLHTRIPILSVFAELRYFFVLLLVVFILRLISTKGDPLFNMPWIILSKQGLMEGAMVCWRLFMVVLLGFLFISIHTYLGHQMVCAAAPGPGSLDT